MIIQRVIFFSLIEYSSPFFLLLVKINNFEHFFCAVPFIDILAVTGKRAANNCSKVKREERRKKKLLSPENKNVMYHE